MKYQNASDILPEKLLNEVRKYIGEGLIYIPKAEKNRQSDYRMQLMKRNQMIIAKFKNRVSVAELADEYFLSIDSVKKIVYSKAKSKLLMYDNSLESALSFDRKGLLEEWVHSHFLITHQNEKMSNDLINGNYMTFGVVKLPLRLVNQVDAGHDSEGDGPLIFSYSDMKFICISGANRFKSLIKNKVNAYQAIVLVDRENSLKFFSENYGKHLLYYRK